MINVQLHTKYNSFVRHATPRPTGEAKDFARQVSTATLRSPNKENTGAHRDIWKVIYDIACWEVQRCAKGDCIYAAAGVLNIWRWCAMRRAISI
jgi:hypothetical protein